MHMAQLLISIFGEIQASKAVLFDERDWMQKVYQVFVPYSLVLPNIIGYPTIIQDAKFIYGSL